MKYSTQDYAKAFAAAIIEAGPDRESVVSANFLGLLRRNGEEARGKKILDATERLLRAKRGGREVVFESARVLSAPHRKDLESMLQPNDAAVLRSNPDLVAGVRVTIDGEYEFDGSLRGKLDRMFAEL